MVTIEQITRRLGWIAMSAFSFDARWYARESSPTRSNSSLLFSRALNRRFLCFLRFCRGCAAWFCRGCAAWFRRRCAALFRGESSGALRMILGCRVLRGRTPWRRVCPVADNFFKPAAAGTTGEQRAQDRYDENAQHDRGFPEDAALPLLKRERPHEIE